MFGFGKKALFKGMEQYVNAVKLATYAKLCADLSDDNGGALGHGALWWVRTSDDTPLTDMIGYHRSRRRQVPPDLLAEHIEREAKLLAGAASNFLFGDVPRPMHAYIPEDLVQETAARLLRDDDDNLPFAVVMSLRTLMTLRADARDSEAMMRIMGRVQWLGGVVPLPSEAPNPGMMAVLAETLQARYVPRGMAG